MDEVNLMMRKWNQDQQGQALVEMAIVIPILLLVVFGIIEFGRIYYTQLDITSAARQAARSAAVHTANEDITRVEDLAIQLAVLNNDRLTTPDDTVVSSILPLTTPEIDWTKSWGTDSGAGSIEISRSVTTEGSPENVTVTIFNPIYIYAPLIDRAFGGDRVVTLRASVVMNIE